MTHAFLALVSLLLLLWSAYAQGADHRPPVITITTPTSANAYMTSTTPLLIGGTASDGQGASATGVSRVTWTNDRGVSGQAQGTTTWSASITLQQGLNTLTVTASDGAGNQGTDTLTVTLMAPPPPPGPITVEWTYSGSGDAFQMERCVAPQPCSMAPVASIAIGDRSWRDETVLSSKNYCYRMAVLTQGVLGDYGNTMCSP